MRNNQLNNMPIPEYNRLQRNLNALSHLIGVLVVFMIYLGLLHVMVNNKKANFGFIDYFSITFYVLMLISQYAISTIYHLDDTNSKEKRIKRLLDHLTIFTVITGTYLPICVIGLKGTIEGNAIIISLACMAVIGIALNIWHMDKKVVRVITLILYIVMGWMLIFVPSAFKQLPFNAFLFILLGGIVYTLGSVLYAIGHLKTQWLHVIFHVFVLAASILQAVGIFYIVMK